MSHPRLAAALARRLPFYYGWVVLAGVCAVAMARTGPAVATLSLFVGPMTQEFGWSRSAMSGAVALGGVLAALTTPMIGTFLDRQGPRTILLAAVLTTSATLLLLSRIESLLSFYLLFCVARLNFAGPFDLGTNGAVANWFVARRPFAMSLATMAQMLGLTLMPLIAYPAIAGGGWRAGWLAIGGAVLVLGFVPTWAFIVGRPEDLGLVPDGRRLADMAPGTTPAAPSDADPTAIAEPAFTRAEAMATSTFWFLSLFTLLVYPVQAGVSLHQAVHLAERKLALSAAVTSVTVASLASALSSFAYGFILRRIGIRNGLVMSGVLLVASTLVMRQAGTPGEAITAALLFGLGMGGIHIGLPVAWADYFGRRSFGAIRGVALTVQVTAQASGPLISGALRDWTGTYSASLLLFATLAGLAALAALFVRAPAPPSRSASPFQAIPDHAAATTGPWT